MPITKGKYRRATIDFTQDENVALEERIRALGCQKAKFVRAAVTFAIRSGLSTIEPEPTPKKFPAAKKPGLKDAFDR